MKRRSFPSKQGEFYTNDSFTAPARLEKQGRCAETARGACARVVAVF